MEFVFLGTGAGVPSKGRNVSAIALQLLEERGQTWLFDCGEATQHQILHTSVRPRRIEKYLLRIYMVIIFWFAWFIRKPFVPRRDYTFNSVWTKRN